MQARRQVGNQSKPSLGNKADERYTAGVTIEAVIDEALKLTRAERARVISRLQESLQGAEEAPGDAEYYAAWTEVLDRCSADVSEGRMGVVDIAESSARAHALATGRR